MQYTEIFFRSKIENFIVKFFNVLDIYFAENIDCGCMEGVPTSTRHLCFGSKIRKWYTPSLLYESGVYEGINITDMKFVSG